MLHSDATARPICNNVHLGRSEFQVNFKAALYSCPVIESLSKHNIIQTGRSVFQAFLQAQKTCIFRHVRVYYSHFRISVYITMYIYSYIDIPLAK